jgi:glycosyltransferase involved in cell wall biosynthesis
LLRVGIDFRPALLSTTGIARSVRELVRALAARADVDLHLYGHSLARARRGEPAPPLGARLHRLPIPGRSLPLLARCGLGADRLGGRVSVFHWTDYVHPPLSRSAAVLTLHDVAFAQDEAFFGNAQSRVLRQRTQRAAARARIVVTPTRASALAASEHLHIPARKMTVIPHGTDHVPADPGPRPIAEPYAVMIGTVEPRKNHVRALAAWRALGRERPRLIVLGRRGWQCDDAVRAIEQARGAGVEWLRDVDDAALFAHLAHAQALLYPSLLEGFGFPPLEALALGVPVVAGDTPALRETLGDAAVFCDPRSIDSIGDACARALHDTALRARLAAAGARICAALTWQECARRWRAVYEQAAQ